MDTPDKFTHARENAAGWYSEIERMVSALDAKVAHHDEDCGADCESDACFIDDDEAREKAQREIEESVLSVQVRGPWYEPGTEAPKPDEFEILLTTGGPALRICGDLDEYGQPTRAYMQMQDWGTPWADYFPGQGSDEVLLTFASQFWFGG